MLALADIPELAILTSPDAAEVALNPMRQRVLGALFDGDSAAGVGRRLGLPRQQVNYHLRELERVGLVREIEQRKRGNCMERVLRACARSWTISPAALGPLGVSPAEARDRFSWATLVHAAARIVRDLGVLRGRADAAGKHLATLTIETEVHIASAARLGEFRAACERAVAAIAAEYHDADAPDARVFRMVLASYPAITKSDTEAQAEAAGAMTASTETKEIEP
jgi:DNA-binding transcriptional ArsR family regulator